MVFIKHVVLFIKNNIVQLRRKWLSLPLVLLFPIIMIGLIVTIVITLLISPTDKPIQLGVVDVDQAEETTDIVNMITESSDIREYIINNRLSKAEEKKKIKKNEIRK